MSREIVHRGRMLRAGLLCIVCLGVSGFISAYCLQIRSGGDDRDNLDDVRDKAIQLVRSKYFPHPGPAAEEFEAKQWEGMAPDEWRVIYMPRPPVPGRYTFFHVKGDRVIRES